MAYMIARQGFVLNLTQQTEWKGEEEEQEALQEILNNCHVTGGYMTLARDLDVMEPKTAEDIYKVLVFYSEIRSVKGPKSASFGFFFPKHARGKGHGG